jgi:hypothetical protein
MIVQGKGILPYRTFLVKNVCAYNLEAHKLPLINASGTLFGSAISHIIRSGR